MNIKCYNIELIDVNENIENFQFSKVPDQDLQAILSGFRADSPHIEFSSNEGRVFMYTKFLRGIMFTEWAEPVKTIHQENIEDSVEIQRINIKKPVFSKPEEPKNA